MESQFAASKGSHGSPGNLDAIVGAILGELDDIRAVLAQGEPSERRELVRRVLAGIRIEKAMRQAVLVRPPASAR